MMKNWQLTTLMMTGVLFTLTGKSDATPAGTAPGLIIDIVPVQVSFPSDFNRDGFIDGADFLLWQIGFGKFPPGQAQKEDGDADEDFDVDGDDFLLWQNGGVQWSFTVDPPLIAAFQFDATFDSNRLGRANIEFLNNYVPVGAPRILDGMIFDTRGTLPLGEEPANDIVEFTFMDLDPSNPNPPRLTIFSGEPNPVTLVADHFITVDDEVFFEFMFSVPEPSTLTLVGLGALAITGYRWRRHR